MAEYKGHKGRWITIKGNHIFVKKGQTASEAFDEWLLYDDADDGSTPMSDVLEIDSYIKRETQLENYSGKGRYRIKGERPDHITDGEYDSFPEALNEFEEKYPNEKIINMIIPERGEFRFKAGPYGMAELPKTIEEKILNNTLDKNKVDTGR